MVPPRIFAAKVVASALRLYARTGIKANTAYTPTAMLRTATSYTGRSYRRGQYELAAADLDRWCEGARE